MKGYLIFLLEDEAGSLQIGVEKSVYFEKFTKNK